MPMIKLHPYSVILEGECPVARVGERVDEIMRTFGQLQAIKIDLSDKAETRIVIAKMAAERGVDQDQVAKRYAAILAGEVLPDGSGPAPLAGGDMPTVH